MEAYTRSNREVRSFRFQGESSRGVEFFSSRGRVRGDWTPLEFTWIRSGSVKLYGSSGGSWWSDVTFVDRYG